ncbi:MAG: hypothetical protein P4L86_09585 [Mycobacterium sp.]|nr:hypothetical protein [Mycobacterium sp.]
MRNEVEAPLARYLVEWYGPHLRDRAIADVARCLRQSLATMPGGPSRPELLCAIAIPQDGYIFGLFAADSADLVAEARLQAWLPADRVAAALEAPATRDDPG